MNASFRRRFVCVTVAMTGWAAGLGAHALSVSYAQFSVADRAVAAVVLLPSDDLDLLLRLDRDLDFSSSCRAKASAERIAFSSSAKASAKRIAARLKASRHPTFAGNAELSLSLAVDYRDLYRHSRAAGDTATAATYRRLTWAEYQRIARQYPGTEQAAAAGRLQRRFEEETR